MDFAFWSMVCSFLFGVISLVCSRKCTLLVEDQVDDHAEGLGDLRDVALDGHDALSLGSLAPVGELGMLAAVADLLNAVCGGEDEVWGVGSGEWGVSLVCS